MFEKLSAVENRYEQIGVELTRPDVASDNVLFTKLMKEHSELTPIVEKYREYCAAVKMEKEALEMLEAGGLDKDFKELVEEELLALVLCEESTIIGNGGKECILFLLQR